MSDLRVDTEAMEETYLKTDNDLWSVTPVWHPKSKGARLVSFNDAGKAKRVINGVIELFQARTSVQHREAVEIFSQDLLGMVLPLGCPTRATFAWPPTCSSTLPTWTSSPPLL
jgi:hypothetical protein